METLDLKWESSSPWENPHPDSCYTMPLTIGEYSIEFFCKGYNLILKTTNTFIYYDPSFGGQREEIKQISYFNMGEFPAILDNRQAMANIERYADYVVKGFSENFNLCHCPSFERIDNVDDNFNPL